MTRAYPTTRSGWTWHYSDLFRRTGRESAARMAAWYQMLHLAFGD